jgi:hypothetical protein
VSPNAVLQSGSFGASGVVHRSEVSVVGV